MKIKKYKNLIIILFAVLAILVVLIPLSQLNSKSKMILFFGDTCPHCKNVEDYIQANNIKNKLSFQELEVYNNAGNASLLGVKAKQCGFDTSNGVGVPFFFDGQNCIQGDEPIIEFLKTK